MAKDTSAQDVYNVDKDVIVPIPYTASEGLNGNFSIKSDVYSYGIFFLFTWCADVYGTCYFEQPRRHICPLKVFSMAEIEQSVCIEGKGLHELPLPCSSTFTDPVQCIIPKFLASILKTDRALKNWKSFWMKHETKTSIWMPRDLLQIYLNIVPWITAARRICWWGFFNLAAHICSHSS